MSWLIIALLAYLILAVVFLIDKYLLTDKISDPKLYTFYTGFFSIFIFSLAFFVDFSVPTLSNFILAFIVGAVFTVALFSFYRSLYFFETSRVVPIVGALSPIFSFFIIFIFSGGKENLSFIQSIAFLILVSGTFLIAYQRKTKEFLKGLSSSIFASFLFALFFVLQKILFENFNSFWNPLIWMSVGSFSVSLCFFIFSEKVKKEVLTERKTFKKKIAFLFFLNKGLAALGGVLQRAAIFLTPGFVEVPIVQSLQGIQYVFLFVMALIFSKKFPEILKEKISREIIVQKLSAIILIGAGLAILILFN